MEKGVCPNCQHVVDVDLEQSGETCPHCQKGYVPHQAKRLFGLLYSQYASNAHIALNVSNNYAKALEQYTKLIELDNDSVDAIFGIAHSRVASSKINGNEIESTLTLISENEDKILANPALNEEVVQNFLTLGQRIDSYVKACDEHLIIDNRFVDELAQERHYVILEGAIKYWEYTERFFVEHFEQNQEAIDIIKKRLSDLRHNTTMSNNYVVIANNKDGYLSFMDQAAFASKMSLFKVRLILIVVQITAVIGAIIGFSIMMSNYSQNPFPGLIVFAVFAVITIIANLVGRVIKNKLSK